MQPLHTAADQRARRFHGYARGFARHHHHRAIRQSGDGVVDRGREDWHYISPLMSFSFTTGPQSLPCAVENLPSSSGPDTTNVICWLSVSAFDTRSSRMLAASSLLNRSRIGFGVPAGANTPHHVYAVRSGTPLSITVAVSGKAGTRFSPVCTIGRSLPLPSCGVIKATLPTMKSTWPPSASFIAGPPPR